MWALAQILKCIPSPSRVFVVSFVHFFVSPRNVRTSVVAFRSREKRRLRKVFFRQRSPRCTRMPLQRASFAKLDLPEMDYNAVRSFEGSRWTIMHLGEVQLCKKSGLWQHPSASRGAISKRKMHDCHATIFEVQARFQNAKCTIESKKS